MDRGPCFTLYSVGAGNGAFVLAPWADGYIFLLLFPRLRGISEEMLTFSSLSSSPRNKQEKCAYFNFVFLLLTWKMSLFAEGWDNFPGKRFGDFISKSQFLR